MELLVELVLEIVLQLFGEFLAELGWRSGKEVFAKRRLRNPWLAGIGSLMLGLVVGLVSLIFFPQHFIQTKAFRLLNLIVTPVVPGIVMWQIGCWRMKRQLDSIRLESFWHGYLFALGMGALRYFLCK